MENYNEKIAILLKKAGVTPANRGWKYITEAVKMAVEDADVPMMNLYFDIARKFNTTKAGVERAIRHSIDCAFNNMPPDIQSAIFGYTVPDNNGKVTNREFITTLAELITTEPNNPIWSM
jgi:two-component system response regulator (stage 0 sporulation protein A)